MGKIQNPKSKFQSRSRVTANGVWNLEFGIWNLSELFLLFSTISLLTAGAQPAQPPPLDPQLYLMMNQPSIEVTTNIQATAGFDPPAVAPGELSTWRVTFNALDESIRWPDALIAPPQLELRLSARGQTLLSVEGKLQPKTTLNHHVRAATNGQFTIPEFQVQVYGRRVLVPASTLEVVSPAPAHAPPLRLFVEVARTNVYVGQPVNVRVVMPALSNQVQVLADLRLNGDGFLVDQGIARQIIGMVPVNGQNTAAYVYETTLTPLNSGALTLSAQAFTAGNRFSGPITIQGQVSIPGGTPQFLLLDSDPVDIRVHPLPPSGDLAGFTGAIGQFTRDLPRLSTNQVRVGDPVNLSVTFRSAGNLARFVAPRPPAAVRWQVFDAVAGVAAPQPGTSPPPMANAANFVYTMIPLTTGPEATPPIPFSYFDPDRGAFVDLTIPSVPVKVLPGAAPVEAQALMTATPESAGAEKKLALSALATAPGRSADRLVPLQQRGWFVVVQLLPVLGFVGLWSGDRRRRFLEQHPDILLRRRARRALHREQRALLNAFQAGDAPRYAAVAVRAMRVAAAPHFPAEPRALVGSDVLNLLGADADGRRRAETIRRFFAVADASQFSGAAADANALLALQPELDRVLAELEARL